MRKWWYRRILIIIVIFTTIVGTGFGMKQYSFAEVDSKVNNQVFVGGMPIGIYMEMDGVLVLSTEAVKGMDGMEREPAKNLVKSGDYIIGIDGEKIANKKELIECVSQLETKELVLNLRREGAFIDVKMNAVQTSSQEYKLGIWVKDNVQGLGTITYLTMNKEFGALGHGLHDDDTEELLQIDEGAVYKTSIVGIEKGEKGTPGGLAGVIVYNEQNRLGEIEKNTENGIYGSLEKVDSLFPEKKITMIGRKNDIEVGDAQIYCAPDGEIMAYDIEIEHVDYYTREKNKGIIIKVVDEELLEKTGGIVQGMSGSPIIQDGKLVGAVTHVLVNDPTRGYGIFIENMLQH